MGFRDKFMAKSPFKVGEMKAPTKAGNMKSPANEGKTSSMSKVGKMDPMANMGNSMAKKKMKMVKGPDGKDVPFYAADGKGAGDLAKKGTVAKKDGPRVKDFSKKEARIEKKKDKKQERIDAKQTRLDAKQDKKKARVEKRKEKRELLESTKGNTGLERRLNYKGEKARAKKVGQSVKGMRAAEKAAKVKPEERKAKQNKATSDHNKRVADAKAKLSNSKKDDTNKKKPHVSYKKAWDTNLKVSADGKTKKDQYGRSYDNTKEGFDKFKQKAIAYTNEQFFKKFPKST